MRFVHTGRHLQNNLMVVAQVNSRELGILLAPLRDVRCVALVALEEVVFSEMCQDICALRRHQHARVFRVGEVDLGDLL